MWSGLGWLLGVGVVVVAIVVLGVLVMLWMDMMDEDGHLK